MVDVLARLKHSTGQGSTEMDSDLLELRFTKVVHREVVGNTKRIKANVITNVSLQVFGIR